MKRYKSLFKESEDYSYGKEQISSLTGMKSALHDVYEDLVESIPISAFSLEVEAQAVSTDGIFFLSKIKSTQQFHCEVKNKTVLTGAIIIEANESKVNTVQVTGVIIKNKKVFNITIR